MAIYNVGGVAQSNAYRIDGSHRSPKGYTSEYQRLFLVARDAWKTEYRKLSGCYGKGGTEIDLQREPVIGIVIHTDQHNNLTTDNDRSNSLFPFLGASLDWDDLSACIGLGDVDLPKANYVKMNAVLSDIPRNKRIDIWGNHDLWNNRTTVDGQFVVDFDTVYPYFSGETFGTSHAYSHKGIEYHIDSVNKVKYVCLAGWEIDTSKGGDSHYVISSQSMEDIIDMLEMDDGNDIVLLSHLSPYTNYEVQYRTSGGADSSETFYEEPVEGKINAALVHTLECVLDDMLKARNDKTAGTIQDSYGNIHSYDFRGLSGEIICSLMGHYHLDGYGYSMDGVIAVEFSAYAYSVHPIYFVSIDRTEGVITIRKITTDERIQVLTLPIKQEVSTD